MLIQTLKEKRAAKISDMRTLNAKALKENRDLDDGERRAFDALDGEVRSLGDQIARAEKLAEYDRLEARAVDGGEQADMHHELRHYSLAKAFSENLNGHLSGVEAEMHQELSRGRETRGLMVPTSVLLAEPETRSVLTSGTGGDLVRTDLAAMTDRRRPALKVQALGATVLSGLVGNLDLPRLSASGTAYWVDEDADTTESDATFEKKSMSPKTVSGQYELSRRMFLQSNESIETILRNDLGKILATAVDLAGIQGGGTNEPTGIMASDAVTQMTSAAMGPDTTADMIAALDVDDVTGTRAFLTHPVNMKIARKLTDTTGLPIPIATTFHNERVESTTLIPVVTAADTDSSTAATYAMIYGEWASLYVGYWSGVDLLLNPYADSVASKGGVLIHAFLDCDVCVRHPEGFRWMEITG